jgi:hypothetical protein
MLFVARVGHRNLVQQLLPILGEGSNIIVISSLGARAVAGMPDCPVLASFKCLAAMPRPGWIVGNSYLTGLRKVCPSSDQDTETNQSNFPGLS